jgi:hypothetical protein
MVIFWLSVQTFRWLTESFSLTQAHDGKYLAKVTAACLKRFGLENLVSCISVKIGDI